MFGIMKKDIGIYLLLFILLLAFLTLYMVMDAMDRGAVMLMGIMVMILLMGGVSANEQNEDKMHGYAFLGTLPVTAREIVSGKFMLPVLFGGLFLIISLTLIKLLAPTPEFWILSRTYMLVATFIGLFLSGLAHAGVYYFGFTRQFKFTLQAAPMLVVMAPIIIRRVYWDEILALDFSTLVAMAEAVHWSILTVLGLSVYAGLLWLAIKTKQARPII